MAKLWNNQFYQHPELAGIRKTLSDSMIGSHARDVGDLRGMLNAERTVEQTMRNRTAQELAGNQMWGNRWATLLGVPPIARPSASPNDEGFVANRQRHEFAKALGGSAAWRKDPHHFASAGKAVGETELQHALLGSKARATDALAVQREQTGAHSKALADRIATLAPEQKKLIEKRILESEAKASAAESLSGLRGAKAGEVSGVEGDLGFENQVKIVTDWFDGVDDFSIPVSLYAELATEPVSQWTSQQLDVARNLLIQDGYTRKQADAIMKFIIEEQTGG